MPKVHFILQGKGGVGKTLVSTFFAQHLLNENENLTCLDLDPVNASFAGFKALNVKPLSIMESATVNPRKFDNLMEILLHAETDVIVDSGASTFLPLVAYLAETKAISVLKDYGKEVLLHVVVTGGQSKGDTLTGLDGIAENLGQDAPLVVWLNEYFGAFAADGSQLEDTGVYIKHKDRISSIVTIPQRCVDTFGKDIAEMLTKKLTFDEAIASTHFRLMSKHRIKMTKDFLFTQLETLNI